MPKQLALWHYERPAEHGEHLHAGTRHGAVIVWERPRRWGAWTKILPRDDLAQRLTAHAGGDDRYFTVNEFSGWRLVKQLRSLRALYVDLDQGKTDAALADWPSIVEAIEDRGLPRPGLVVHSGRGLHLYWLLEPLPAQALPVWQAAERELVSRLADLGADPIATDCTRVLRLIGTRNTKSDTLVRGWVLDEVRWPLREIARHILRPSPTTSLEAHRAAQRAKRAPSVHQRCGPWRLWHGRYQALSAIADHHAFLRSSGVAEGNRDRLLFLLSNALSWFTKCETLGDEIQRVARLWVPTLSPTEVATYTRTVVQRATDAAAGKLVAWGGEMRDPRYAYRTERLRLALGDLLTPEVEALPAVRAGLALWTADEAAARKRASDRARAKGLYTGDGVRSANHGKREEALRLAAAGQSLRGIAAALGVSHAAVGKWVRAAAGGGN